MVNKLKTPSKLYFFNHSILSGIRHGIQATHVTTRLLRKYLGDLNPEVSVSQSHAVRDWTDKYETVIILEGGFTPAMNRVKRLIKASGFPWAEFREPDYGKMVTSIAVLVPEDFYVFPHGRNYSLYELLRRSNLAK